MPIITGLHSIEKWVEQSPPGAVLYIAKPTKRNNILKDMARRKGINIQIVELRELDRLSGGGEHKGIALVLKPGREKGERELAEILPGLGAAGLIMVLDGITDPRNLGAILRSAEQFGADAVVLPQRRSAADTPAVSRTSAGADALITIITTVNISRAIEEIKKNGFWVFGAAMEGEPAAGADLQGKVCLVVGSEGKGLRQNVRSHCDKLISIPTTGRVDSLNVAVAAGILLYEIRRQQSIS